MLKGNLLTGLRGDIPKTCFHSGEAKNLIATICKAAQYSGHNLTLNAWKIPFEKTLFSCELKPDLGSYITEGISHSSYFSVKYKDKKPKIIALLSDFHCGCNTHTQYEYPHF